MTLLDRRSALEACLREELSAKAAQCSLLATMESAIHAADPTALEQAGQALLLDLEAGVERARTRGRALEELAQALEVAPARVETLAEALGDDGGSLLAQRSELRALCADSLARGRRLASLVRAHGALVEEVLGRFLAPDASGAPLGRGCLVDARA